MDVNGFESVIMGDLFGSENETELGVLGNFGVMQDCFACRTFDCGGFVNGFNLSSRYVESDAGADDSAAA